MNQPETVLVISDALGETAASVALAAAGQFDEGAVAIERLSRVQDARQVKSYLEPLLSAGKKIAAFHTIVQDELRSEVTGLLVEQGIAAVDLLGPAIDTIAALTGFAPKGIPGIIHRTDEHYFQRIACMEYAVEHEGSGRPLRSRYRAHRRVPYVQDAAFHVPGATGISRGEYPACTPDGAPAGAV